MKDALRLMSKVAGAFAAAEGSGKESMAALIIKEAIDAGLELITQGKSGAEVIDRFREASRRTEEIDIHIDDMLESLTTEKGK